MKDQSTSRLIRLSDTNLTLEHAKEDVRGFKVIDSGSNEIGHVDDLIIDESQKKVRFLVVAAGGFLGLGEKRFWLPIDTVEKITDENLYVDTSADHLKGSPAYDPDIVSIQPHADDVYDYYGISPFWGAGYIYPAYPFITGGPGFII